MWPLSLVLLFATAAPPRQDLNAQLREQQLKKLQNQRFHLASRSEEWRKLGIENAQRDTCYTMRSYFFRRQDGQAPVLAGTTTCTPANKLQQKRVSPQPGVKYVPLSSGDEKQPD